MESEKEEQEDNDQEWTLCGGNTKLFIYIATFNLFITCVSIYCFSVVLREYIDTKNNRGKIHRTIQLLLCCAATFTGTVHLGVPLSFELQSVALFRLAVWTTALFFLFGTFVLFYSELQKLIVIFNDTEYQISTATQRYYIINQVLAMVFISVWAALNTSIRNHPTITIILFILVLLSGAAYMSGFFLLTISFSNRLLKLVAQSVSNRREMGSCVRSQGSFAIDHSSPATSMNRDQSSVKPFGSPSLGPVIAPVESDGIQLGNPIRKLSNVLHRPTLSPIDSYEKDEQEFIQTVAKHTLFSAMISCVAILILVCGFLWSIGSCYDPTAVLAYQIEQIGFFIVVIRVYLSEKSRDKLYHQMCGVCHGWAVALALRCADQESPPSCSNMNEGQSH